MLGIENVNNYSNRCKVGFPRINLCNSASHNDTKCIQYFAEVKIYSISTCDNLQKGK